jgi:hypothetical protein
MRSGGRARRGSYRGPSAPRGPRSTGCPRGSATTTWHYFASLLIASGADVKVVQKRLRHASAMTTLNTYGHMWPDADESARAAVGVVLAARADSLVKVSCGLTAD